MANVLGIIRNKASGIAGAVELFIDNVKQTQYKKCYITNENIIGFEGKNGEVSSGWGGSSAHNTAWYNNGVYCVYQNRLYKYYPSSNSWSKIYEGGNSLYGGCLASLNGTLYYFGSSSNPKYICKWKGSSWDDFYLTASDSISYGCPTKHGSYLYIGNGYGLWKFTGSTITKVANIPYSSSSGSCIVSFNNEIHWLGGSSSTYGVNHYAWNGSSWRSVSTIPFIFYKGIAEVINNKIVIMGSNYTDTTSNKTSNIMGVWDGNSWTTSRMPYKFAEGSSCIDSNGDVYIKGGIEKSGSTSYYHPEYFAKAFGKISYRLSNS